MPRFPRAVAIGVAHHITQRGIDRGRVFFTDSDRITYLELLAQYASQSQLRILSYGLMDNHFHLVAIPEHSDSLAVTMRRTQGRYSLFLNARKRRTGHLWQNRFYSCALDEAHLRVTLRYVERNPVRANLVIKPEDYRWSSAAAHLGFAVWPSWLDQGFHSQFGGQESWSEMMAEAEELLAIRQLQRGTFSGRPVGSVPFIEGLEQLLGRSLRSRQGQRPQVKVARPLFRKAISRKAISDHSSPSLRTPQNPTSLRTLVPQNPSEPVPQNPFRTPRELVLN